jgi:hypothetical protein
LGSGYLIRPISRRTPGVPRIFYAIAVLTCRDGYPIEYMPRKFYKMGGVIECDSRDDIKKMGVPVIKTAVVFVKILHACVMQFLRQPEAYDAARDTGTLLDYLIEGIKA